MNKKTFSVVLNFIYSQYFSIKLNLKLTWNCAYHFWDQSDSAVGKRMPLGCLWWACRSMGDYCQRMMMSRWWLKSCQHSEGDTVYTISLPASVSAASSCDSWTAAGEGGECLWWWHYLSSPPSLESLHGENSYSSVTFPILQQILFTIYP